MSPSAGPRCGFASVPACGWPRGSNLARRDGPAAVQRRCCRRIGCARVERDEGRGGARRPRWRGVPTSSWSATRSASAGTESPLEVLLAPAVQRALLCELVEMRFAGVSIMIGARCAFEFGWRIPRCLPERRNGVGRRRSGCGGWGPSGDHMWCAIMNNLRRSASYVRDSEHAHRV